MPSGPRPGRYGWQKVLASTRLRRLLSCNDQNLFLVQTLRAGYQNFPLDEPRASLRRREAVRAKARPPVPEESRAFSHIGRLKGKKRFFFLLADIKSRSIFWPKGFLKIRPVPWLAEGVIFFFGHFEFLRLLARRTSSRTNEGYQKERRDDLFKSQRRDEGAAPTVRPPGRREGFFSRPGGRANGWGQGRGDDARACGRLGATKGTREEIFFLRLSIFYKFYSIRGFWGF